MTTTHAAEPVFLRDRMRGKVVLVTGAARGQGRSHAVRLAQEGADVIALDLCGGRDLHTVPYELPLPEELDETARLVEALGRRVTTRLVDIRDRDALAATVDEAVEAMGGGLDAVAANAGIASWASTPDITPDVWDEMIGVNLTGAWYTAQTTLPHLIRRGAGSSIVFTASTAALRGNPDRAHYAAAEHGVVGVVRTLAKELASSMIRVNAVAPTAVDTPMVRHDRVYELARPDLPRPTQEDIRPILRSRHLLPVPWVEAVDVSNALLFLMSDEARYLTGVVLPVDAGRIAN